MPQDGYATRLAQALKRGASVLVSLQRFPVALLEHSDRAKLPFADRHGPPIPTTLTPTYRLFVSRRRFVQPS